MKHRINGIALNLRELTEYELSALVAAADQRIADAADDKEKLVAELIRRTDNVHQLRLEYEGPSVA